jgi:PD-(D/E)XK endonuclease
MRKDSRKSREPGRRSAPLVRGELSSKTKGDLGELAFSHKAASLGFGVAEPHGEDEAYDFILDSGKRLWRVQVKSIYSPFRNGYRTAGRRNNQDIYKAEEIDFLVAYIAPLDIWYVIPVNHIAASRILPFYPSGCKRGGHFECYREAWHLMATGPDATPQSRILRRVHGMAY